MTVLVISNRATITMVLATLLGCSPPETVENRTLLSKGSGSCYQAVTKGLKGLSEEVPRFDSKDQCSNNRLVCIMREGMTVGRMMADSAFPNAPQSARLFSCPSINSFVPSDDSAIVLFSDRSCPEVLVTNKRLMTDKSFGAYGCMKASDISITRLDNISYSISGAE